MFDRMLQLTGLAGRRIAAVDAAALGRRGQA